MNALLQYAIYLGVLLLLVKPLGAYMANVYEGRYRFLAPLENLVYRAAGVQAEEEMNWKRYLWGVLWFNLAVSFITNTNWQGYGGESTMSYLTQMLGLSVQNFFSAATGMAVLTALTRGFARKQTQGIGNVWADLTRTTLYILLPLSLLLAGVFVTQGVVQTFAPYKTVDLVQQPLEFEQEGKKLSTTEQTLALGPAASQIAIKQLGTNGGGFYNVNSAHPYENPTPLSNFLEMLSILLISAALCYTFGRMVGDTRQGWALLAAMTVVFVGF